MTSAIVFDWKNAISNTFQSLFVDTSRFIKTLLARDSAVESELVELVALLLTELIMLESLNRTFSSLLIGNALLDGWKKQVAVVCGNQLKNKSLDNPVVISCAAKIRSKKSLLDWSNKETTLVMEVLGCSDKSYSLSKTSEISLFVDQHAAKCAIEIQGFRLTPYIGTLQNYPKQLEFDGFIVAPEKQSHTAQDTQPRMPSPKPPRFQAKQKAKSVTKDEKAA